MATAASSAANSASPIHRYPTDRSPRNSSPWSIVDDPALSVSRDVSVLPPATPSVPPPAGKDTSDNADKKPVWNKPSSSSAESRPVMGAESWPALSLSARASPNRATSLESDGLLAMPPPQARGAPLSSSSNSNANANSSENHPANGQRKPPFRRNNTTPSSSDQNHSQRGGSYGSGPGQFRGSNRGRNSNSYPRGDHGNRRSYEHGNQGGFAHRNYNGRDMQMQPPAQRGAGMVRPQMMMGPPSLPASSAQYMAAAAAAPQIGSYGGPINYTDYAPPPIFVPHPPPQPMALVGHFPPVPFFFPSFEVMLQSRILIQVEYYFSADNLCKDEHLRKHMDDEGWVPVRVITTFNRIAMLTQNIQTILEALRCSEVVEIKGETIRRRGDWDKYLMPHDPSTPGDAAEVASSGGSVQSQLESMTI